ncbi:hypothetical protein BJ742DRAFT_676944, partial [Cladochytrium replicatum]
LKENLSIPVFANGDVFSRADADPIAEYTATRLDMLRLLKTHLHKCLLLSDLKYSLVF